MSEKLAFEKIITGLPTRAGRGLEERASRVERAALDLGLSVERTGPLSKNEKIAHALASDPPDAVFVIDFAQLIREPLLSAPRNGCLNIHPSLLPKWRGAAPIQRALMNGDEATGVTLFRLVEELDAGPMLAQREIPIPITANSDDLIEILALAGSQIAIQSVESIIEGNYQFSDQNSEFATYAAKIDKAEEQISWSQTCLKVHNTVRALASSSGAFALALGKRLKLWRTAPVNVRGEPGKVLFFTEGDPVVACTDGAVRLLEVQGEGKRRTSGAEWARGVRLKEGEGLT